MVLAALAAPAGAAPGSLDRSFGRDGRVAFDQPRLASALVPLSTGLAVLSDDQYPGLVELGDDGRRRPSRLRGTVEQALAVLPDGRVLTESVSQGAGRGELVTRRRADGSLDRAFGQDGRYRLTLRAQVLAVSRRGRTVAARSSAPGERTVLRAWDSDGLRDLGFSPAAFTGFLRAAAFDHAGRVVVLDEGGRLSRLLADGRRDPGFAGAPAGTGDLVVAPSGRGVLVLAPAPVVGDDGTSAEGTPTLFGAGGRPIATAPAVTRVLRGAQAALFDAADRLLVSDGRRLHRVAPDGQSVELLRSRLFRGPRTRTTTLAVDRRGRVLVGGYELLDDGFDPLLTDDINFSARTRDVVLRLLG